LSKEDRYGFKLAVGSGAGRSARIFHHPIHQGQSDDMVLCALGLSQGRCWTIWLGCPKDKIVRLVRLFRRHHDIGLPDEPWTAPVIPLRVPLRRAQPQHRLRP
jgi:hypothetical protein